MTPPAQDRNAQIVSEILEQLPAAVLPWDIEPAPVYRIAPPESTEADEEQP